MKSTNPIVARAIGSAPVAKNSAVTNSFKWKDKNGKVYDSDDDGYPPDYSNATMRTAEISDRYSPIFIECKRGLDEYIQALSKEMAMAKKWKDTEMNATKHLATAQTALQAMSAFIRVHRMH